MSSHGPGCEMADTPLACKRKVPAHYLMCGPHWALVPITVQRRVYDGLYAGLDSDEYKNAVADAVRHVLASNGIREGEPAHDRAACRDGDHYGQCPGATRL